MVQARWEGVFDDHFSEPPNWKPSSIFRGFKNGGLKIDLRRLQRAETECAGGLKVTEEDDIAGKVMIAES